jgi:hypothetical protein
MNDAADDPSIVHARNAAHIRRQTGLNPLPLLVIQPEEVFAHDPDPERESGEK